MLASVQKTLGAYYTDHEVVDFLVRWAVRSAGDRVLDPSCGDGRFLRAALDRIGSLGAGSSAQQGAQVEGVDLDPRACAAAVGAGSRARRIRVACRDFFEVDPPSIEAVDAVVGNPPFIRYQLFDDRSRDRAIARGREVGLSFPKLSSSWAPFVVHATRFVRPGGRLAMVVPAEIVSTGYGLPVLDFVAKSFARTRLLTFASNIFDTISEETMLLLAEGKDGPAQPMRLLRLSDKRELSDFLSESGGIPTGPANDAGAIDTAALGARTIRFAEYLLPAEARRVYKKALESQHVARLGEIASVDTGYVTGNNEFFHLSAEEAERRGIPPELLMPAVRGARALSGLALTAKDFSAKKGGDACYLLRLAPSAALDVGVRQYIEEGESREVHAAYKCRVRSPWWSVPHVNSPDLFMTYMSGDYPRFVANDARATHTNTVHGVKLLGARGEGTVADRASEARLLAMSFHCTLSFLSAELEGRSYGGGVLKLEPTEAERVRVVRPDAGAEEELRASWKALDKAARGRDFEGVAEVTDGILLGRQLGLSRGEIETLRAGARALRERRAKRNRKASA